MNRMPEFAPTFETIIGVVVASVFVALLIFETRFSLRQPKRPKAQRFVINVGVSALALGTGAYIVGPIAFRLSEQSSETSFGLLRLVPLPYAAEFVAGFLLMDLTFYYWHRANHSIPLFWRFHNVHHVDPDLDVSTSFRFHFGEVLYSVGFRALQVYLLGISLFTYLVYELVFQCATMFHHSNVRLPITVERWLNQIVVTPRMHGIHHSIVKDETNSNYSVIFRWWDLMHGTLKLNVNQSDVVIGVPAYLGPEDNKFWNLLVQPFRKQREYWRLRDGKQPERARLEGSKNSLLS
jgi:sterol desaturase/sphingolipid hydroxylase (fatty acid hydroxylase superfamily)